MKGIDSSQAGRRTSLFDDDDMDIPSIIEKFSLDTMQRSSGSRLPEDSKGKSASSSNTRAKVLFAADDPLQQKSREATSPTNVSSEKPKVIKKENLIIRLEDESRIVSALKKAAKKQTSGSLYSVKVDISKTGTLGIGVKDLSDSVLAVSMLKRENGKAGAGEEAGLRLGDIIFGINFIPTTEGSKTLIRVIKRESARGKKVLYLQAWRCHQLCSDPIPGYLFSRADEVIVQAYALFQSKVFSDWERWNFVEILLGNMVEDLKLRTTQDSGFELDENQKLLFPSKLRARQLQILDLEKNILQAKGLRTAMCVRIVSTKNQSDSLVVYVLRVEDVESGLQWVVQRRYSDFHALNEELLDMSQFAKEVEFPKKRISIRNTAKLVEMRVVALEQYIRRMMHTLTMFATMDAAASRSLRHLQNFLGVEYYMDCVHPPVVDDQRYIELMAYRFLNDFSSPACEQCIRFTSTADLDSMADPNIGIDGFRPVLAYMKAALSEVEQFVMQQHQQQIIQSLKARRPDFSPEQLRSFVRKCVRRQVEAAVYLPLRRTVIRIVQAFLVEKSSTILRAMSALQQVPTKYFQIDDFVPRAQSLPATVQAFRKVMQAFLPADQGQLLIEAANAVTQLHRECQQEKQRLEELSQQLEAEYLEQQRHQIYSSYAGPSMINPSGNKLPPPAPVSLPLGGTMALAINPPNAVENVTGTSKGRRQSGNMSVLDEEGNIADGDIDGEPNRVSFTVNDASSVTLLQAGRSESLQSHHSSNGRGTPSRSNSITSSYSTTKRQTSLNDFLNDSIGNDAYSIYRGRSLRRPSSTAGSSSGGNNGGGSSPKSFSPTTSYDSLGLNNAASSPGGKTLASNLIKDETRGGEAFDSPSDSSGGLGVGKTLLISSSLTGNINSDERERERRASVGRTQSFPLSMDPNHNGNNSGASSPSRDQHSKSFNHNNNNSSSAAGSQGSVANSNPSTITGEGNEEEEMLSINERRLEALESLEAFLGDTMAEQAAAVRALKYNTNNTSNSNHVQKSISSPTVDNKSSTSITKNVDASASNPVDQNQQNDAIENGDKSPADSDSGSNYIGEASSQKKRGSKTNSVPKQKTDYDPLLRPSLDPDEVSDMLRELNLRPASTEEEAAHGLARQSSFSTYNVTDAVNGTDEEAIKQSVISADDFLPLFTYVLVQAGSPQLMLGKELMVGLVDDEEAFGECGYYLATLEAAIQHLIDLAAQYPRSNDGGEGGGPYIIDDDEEL